MDRKDLFNYLLQKYDAQPNFLWQKYPDYAVFKHENGKWFALVMGVSGDAFDRNDEGKLDVVDLKIDPEMADILRAKDYFFPGYHMNKRTWTSVLIQDIQLDELAPLIEESFQRTK